jgi:hypothetical protein
MWRVQILLILRTKTMRKLTHVLLSISATALLLSLLSGCQSLALMEKPAPVPTQIITTHQQVQPFTAIVVDGPMDIDLIPQPPTERLHRLTFVSSRETAGSLVASVDNGVLYLRNMEKMHAKGMPRPQVKVPVGELHFLNYNSSGILSGQRIRGQNLTKINVNGGVVSLSGPEIGLRSLTVTGGGNVSISNIKTSQTLYVRGKDNTRIALKGRAQAIEVVLSLNSALDARFLRAENGFVNTTDNARADVNVRHSLNAFATGTSNIYYHQQQPELLSKYLRHASSVLFFQ